MIRTSCGALTLAVGVSVLGGCATVSASGPRGTCTSDLAPSALSLDEVLDSAYAQNGISAVWPAGAGLVLGRVGGTTDSSPDTVRVFSEGLGDDQLDELRGVLRRALHSTDANSERTYLVIGDERGPGVRRVDGVATCAPRVLNELETERRILNELTELNLRERRVVRLMVSVSKEGQVEEVRIDESSGSTLVDLAAARVFQQASFSPALVEGMPAPVWITLPVTFTPRYE